MFRGTKGDGKLGLVIVEKIVNCESDDYMKLLSKNILTEI